MRRHTTRESTMFVAQEMIIYFGITCGVIIITHECMICRMAKQFIMLYNLRY